MEKRNRETHIIFTDSEYRLLCRKAQEAGLSRSAFIRRAVSDKDYLPVSIEEIPVLIMEVRQVGSTLEQILREVRSCGAPGVLGLEQALAENRDLERKIAHAYVSEWR